MPLHRLEVDDASDIRTTTAKKQCDAGRCLPSLGAALSTHSAAGRLGGGLTGQRCHQIHG